jgi:hypothetical protein
MRKVVPVMKSVSGLARKQTATAISIGLPKPTDGLVHDVLKNILLAKLRVVTPLPLRSLDEKLVQLRCVDQGEQGGYRSCLCRRVDRC